MQNGNYVDYSYYEHYPDALEFETREYYRKHYGVEFSSYNPKDDSCVSKPMMDSVIDAIFGPNFYKSVYVTNRKLADKHANQTELDSYSLDSDLIYNENEFDFYKKYIETEIKKNFPELSKLPPCQPARTEYIIYIGVTGTIDSAFILHKLSPNFNKRLLELIYSYPYKFTPVLEKATHKPVIVEIWDYLSFTRENPYYRSCDVIKERHFSR
jgi:hypothetical protein